MRAHDGHLLQSWEWGAFKQRHGWIPDRIRVETPDGAAYAQVLYRSRGPVSLGYIPRGPVITGDVAAVWPALRDELDRSARRHRAITTVIEPDTPLELTGTFHEAGVVVGPGHIQPSRTVVVPLLDDETILKQMHQKTRYNVRLAQRRGVTTEIATGSDADLSTFYQLMTDTAERNSFGVHSYEYYADFLRAFGDDAALLFAYSNGNVAATLVTARFGNEAIYMYGGSSTEHRAHGAAFLLQFDAMRWARERGCSRYDLWGIMPHDPKTMRSDDPSKIAGTSGEDMRGLYRFKTGFGGEIVSYPSTMERRHVPVLPWLARKLNVIKG